MIAWKLGISVLLLVIFLASFSMGPLGMLFSILPGMLLGLLWIAPLLGIISGGAINSLLGGGGEVEAKPLYSVAETKRRQGKPILAIELIEEELVKFPCDFEGQMLKAQIQMESMGDFHSAEGTILCIAAQPQHGPGQIATALNQLADWQKKRGDVEGVKLTLAGLRDSYPDTAIEFSCAQRLARLDFYVDSNDPRDASEIVSECLKQLDEHPLDSHTREQLARVYFSRYGKPDLAWEEMNKLFVIPFQKPRDLARWLNLMTDWHLEKNNPVGARECLKQIMSRFPDLPYCVQAQERLTRIKDL